jgi:hypothetical protein
MQAGIEFNRDIRPVLASKCYACHGPDEDKREAGLRLDVREEAVKEVINPGQPEQSDFWKRITSHDPDEVMPPPSSPKPLSDSERQLFRQWIAEGAEYQQHWSFVPIQRPPVPVPAGDARNPIDAFVRAALSKHHLLPAPKADPITLLRRVSLDLTGLPPGPEEVRAFVKSGGGEAAYLALVDRLLASPHFGERWGRHWLDMARYADSNGFLGDGLRKNAWKYRDWVIEAFNSDLPFDEFTVQQLAGDVLALKPAKHGPEPADSKLLTATGFHRNAALNTEAGVDKEEARFQNLADRVNTTGRVWMGLTVGCAQCHTHKYDPITIRDYYSLYAFFNNTADKDDAETQAPALVETRKDRRQTYVHLAGDYARRGPDVMPASLSALPAMPKSSQAEATRLDLAQWLVSPDHPLTSRVAVNHIWSKLFGIGIVSTPDDFGATGEPPSHPELLDFLASEFMSQGWSRKALIRQIVTSETYRQSSEHREDIVEIDPLNRLLSRQNRLRLDAEILRDSALTVSGLLTTSLGGPSFRPPLPEDVFDVGRSKNWQADTGGQLYRRSLYIITLRSVLYPLLTTFDAPDAADACVKRERSNTPLQALTMMNDPVFVEAAQALAVRVVKEVPERGVARVGRLFDLCLARKPLADELAQLKRFYREQMARVKAERATSLQVLGAMAAAVPKEQHAEAATYVALARILMNVDEFINRQ